MDIWLSYESHARRKELLASAHRARLARLAQGGRSRGFRGRIADGAQIVSELLASFAHAVREQA
jgi:hypothetical protein